MIYQLMAEKTATALKKEHPEWDVESLVNETVEIIEMEMREDIAHIERHLPDFLSEQLSKNLKKKSDDKE